MRRTVFLIPVLITLVISTAFAKSQAPSAQRIAEAVQRNFEVVQDYKADISLTIKGPRISINNMRMKLYYKKPNKVHVDAEQGMGIIPPGSYFGNPFKELLSGARPVYVKSEQKCGRDCHVLKFKSTANRSAQPVTVWVDKERNLILATNATGYGATTTQWRYERVGGKYWLPIEITAESQMPNDRGKSKARVVFSNYRVNKGISDKIFEEKSRSK